MHKIIKTFKSRKKIIKLKDIMKAVYSAASNQIADIAKLNLKKALIPHQVERAEIEIKSLTHKELITVPKNSLTFLSGTELPFTIIDNDSNLAGEYIVLPWELNSREGKDILKNIIKKIPFIPQSLTYTLYINLEENTNPVPQANQDITQALSVVTQSVEDYSWSDDSFTEDNVEGLLQELEKLKKEVEALKQERDYKKRLEFNKELEFHQGVAPKNGDWTIELPSKFIGKRLNTKSLYSPSGIEITEGANKDYVFTSTTPMSVPDIKHKITIDNVAGNIICDIDNKKLIIGGSSFGNLSAQ
ncbi:MULTISPECIES: hypothetical protein [unclassified Rickettsia]|uniref:hypothetical protein n=1 Tax=unclassified Rickettsia TaxID=114295 RepID=UPI00313347FE